LQFKLIVPIVLLHKNPKTFPFDPSPTAARTELAEEKNPKSPANNATARRELNTVLFLMGMITY